MANIKFSGFTEVTSISAVQEIVGYNGTQNVRITPANFLSSLPGGPFLPLAGGTMTGVLKLNDGVVLQLGSSADLQLFHESDNSYISNFIGDLTIRNLADDKDIIFRNDNGSGGTTTYLTIDGLNENLTFSKPAQFLDGVYARFGNSSDLQIYHDGSNSYIKETGAGTLNLQGSTQVLISSATTGEVGVQYVENAGVGLRHNNVQKFSTTNAGVAIPSGQSVDFIDTNLGYNTIKRNSTLGGLEIRTGGAASVNILDNSKATFAGDVEAPGIYVGATNTAFDFYNQGTSYFNGTVTVDAAFTQSGGDASTFSGNVKIEDTIELTDSGATRGKIELNASDRDDLDIKAISLGSNMKFFTVDSERMRLDASGNLGIGTTSPGQKLQISGGNSSTSATAIFSIQKGEDGYGLFSGILGSGDAWIQSSTETESAYYGLSLQPNGGNVGIGITSPIAKLHVYQNNTEADTAAGVTIEQDGTGDAALSFLLTNTRRWRMGIDNSDSDKFKISDATNLDAGNKLTISTSGNVGIGTTSPNYALEVRSASPFVTANSTGTSSSGFVMLVNAGSNGVGVIATDDGGSLTFDNGATGAAQSEKMRINSSGNLTIGSTANAGYRLKVEGSGTVQLNNRTGSDGAVFAASKDGTIVGSISVTGSATAYNTSSDYRLKEDLQDFKGLDLVSKIPVYDYKWKSSNDRGYGVMAHELEEVLPDAVTGNKDAEEMQGVDYSKIVPLLIKSIQELSAKVKELESKQS